MSIRFYFFVKWRIFMAWWHDLGTKKTLMSQNQEAQLSLAYRFIYEDMLDEAEVVINCLEEDLGDAPEIQEVRALWDRENLLR